MKDPPSLRRHCENCGAEDNYPAIRFAYVTPPYSEQLLLFLCTQCRATLNAQSLVYSDYLRPDEAEKNATSGTGTG